MASACGIIMDPRDTSRTYCASGLGIVPNNMTELYALGQGFKVANGMCVQSLIVIGDSKTITSHMVHNSKLSDHTLASIRDRSMQETSLFTSITFYQVLHDLNKEADRWANYGARLKVGELVVYGTLEKNTSPKSLQVQ